MNKCLVFTLPRAISDATLPKMGVFSARIELRGLSNINESYISITTNAESIATIIPDEGSTLSFVDSQGNSRGSSVTLYKGANGLFTSLGSGTIEITNKESITGFTGLTVDVENLKYLPSLNSIDLRNLYTLDASKRSHGDISGIASDYLVATSFCTNYNNVTYDVSRIPKDIFEYTGGVNNLVGLYCSNQNRKGSDVLVITTGQYTPIRFSKVEDARNFILANAECVWIQREFPRISITTLENGSVNPFTNDADVINAINKLKDMGVTTFEINYFAV